MYISPPLLATAGQGPAWVSSLTPPLWSLTPVGVKAKKPGSSLSPPYSRTCFCRSRCWQRLWEGVLLYWLPTVVVLCELPLACPGCPLGSKGLNAPSHRSLTVNSSSVSFLEGSALGGESARGPPFCIVLWGEVCLRIFLSSFLNAFSPCLLATGVPLPCDQLSTVCHLSPVLFSPIHVIIQRIDESAA